MIRQTSFQGFLLDMTRHYHSHPNCLAPKTGGFETAPLWRANARVVSAIKFYGLPT